METLISPLLPINGIRVGTACAGIKKPNHPDLVLFEIAESTVIASVFTKNVFCAAPVIVSKKHLNNAKPRYLLINTGNANAGTGHPGIEAAISCCARVSLQTGCQTEQVLPFSTGVIGEDLAVDRIFNAIPDVAANLDANGWESAAQGILTTDTVAKGISRNLSINGQTVSITGIAKGSGMIRPDMATMLAFIATDANISTDVLQSSLQAAVDVSFNRITVDGDTSTNDACMLMATGFCKDAVISDIKSEEYTSFTEVLSEICIHLAKSMIVDGEGATKLVSIVVEQGADEQECEQVAYTVAHSPLVKTALFACDPNWGRILAAVGRSGLNDLDLNKIEIYLNQVCIVRNGGRAEDYTETAGQAVMDQAEIEIRIVLDRGTHRTNIWTCDFSYDYVRINAEYRT